MVAKNVLYNREQPIKLLNFRNGVKEFFSSFYKEKVSSK
jgi:hypothetical protein